MIAEMGTCLHLKNEKKLMFLEIRGPEKPHNHKEGN